MRASRRPETTGASRRAASYAAQVAARAGDVSTVAAMAAQAYRHADAIGFDAFQVPAMLLEAWVAERRSDRDAAAEAYQRAFALAGRAGFADHASFALAGLGWNAFASGDLRDAEELERRALAAAEAARSPWAAAHARVRLARVLAAAGDAETAEALYRDVLEWFDKPRPHGARESLFLALAEDPGAAARVGLDDLGQPPRVSCGRVGARRDRSDVVARIRECVLARRREWQRGLVRGRALAVAHGRLVVESIRQRQEVRVATKTTDEMLAEIRRHIDDLEARADSGTAETRARLQDRFDVLREQEASAWAAVRERAEAVDEKFRQLEIDITIAENRLASETADDATSFAEAVEAELRDWDAAIERLQTRAATKAQDARGQAEAEIAELRQARNRAAERLTALPRHRTTHGKSRRTASRKRSTTSSGRSARRQLKFH